MNARQLVTLALFTALIAQTGCRAQKREPEPVRPRTVPIFAGDASGVVPWDRVADVCADSAVVLIGEVHGHPLGLEIAAELFDDILERSPGAVLSMEFYERDHQGALDDYGAGIIDAEQFDKSSFRTRCHCRAEQSAKNQFLTNFKNSGLLHCLFSCDVIILQNYK